MILANADQAFQAAAGSFEGGALLGLGGLAGDALAFGGQLGLTPAVAGAGGAVDGVVLVEASGGGGPWGVVAVLLPGSD